MSQILTEAERRIGGLLESMKIPGRQRVDVTPEEVTITVSDIPFVAHGMQFTRAIRYHFTLVCSGDGMLRTYWGEHSWAGEGKDRAPCKTQEQAAEHADLDSALNWLGEAVTTVAK